MDPIACEVVDAQPIPETAFAFRLGGTQTVDIPALTAVKLLSSDPRRATVYVFCDTLELRLGPSQAEAMDARTSFVFSSDRGMLISDYTSELWGYNPQAAEVETACILTEQWAQ